MQGGCFDKTHEKAIAANEAMASLEGELDALEEFLDGMNKGESL